MEVVLDLEANELLQLATKTWIVGWHNLTTDEVVYWLDGDMGWVEELNKVTHIIGHNIAGYDLPLLKKLFGWEPGPHVRITDTFIYSMVLDYNRFADRRHGLAAWGRYLNCPKGEFSDFSKYSEEMLVYWKQDLKLTKLVYEHILPVYVKALDRNERIATYIRAENSIATWCAEAELHGWDFDLYGALKLLVRIEGEMQAIRNKLLPRLGTKTVATDKKLGVVPERTPKILKDGRYDHHTAKWFEINPWSATEDDDRPIEGPYCRVEFVDLDINSVSDVKTFLYRNGWEPDEWNYKEDPDNPRRKIQASPKITESSLEFLGGDGKLYCDFLTMGSRLGILKGLIKHCDYSRRVHGNCFPLGTPSMRATHRIIVNLPTIGAVYGAEMRALFKVPKGWKMVGADSSGNQARGLAHYLKSPEYIHILLHGDVHTMNAELLDQVLKDMGISWNAYLIGQGIEDDPKELAKAKRGAAKRILYAFLFGASGGKMWSYIFGIQDKVKGAKLKAGFTKAVPGFKALIDKLENIYGKTKQFGDGYIPGPAGNRIYCDSFHKLLVYLLQATEKATCGAACLILSKWLKKEKIPYQPLIFMHDELDFMVPEEYAERAAELGKRAFQEGPKLFGITIMDGEAKIGMNWKECH